MKRFICGGFTIIELLVVLAIVATLTGLVAPRYIGSLDKAKEQVLKENLHGMRDALDRFYGDRGEYPKNLQELVSERYLRTIPMDPITESPQTWIPVPQASDGDNRVWDVRSGAEGRTRDGVPYRDL